VSARKAQAEAPLKNRTAATALFLSLTVTALAHVGDFMAADGGLYLSDHVPGANSAVTSRSH